MINQGVSAALAARDATRNGTDSHILRETVVRGSRTAVTQDCTYQDFMKGANLCNFKGTDGVVELTQWFERMETVFRISNCSAENQIKFATSTLLAVPDMYCPRNENEEARSRWELECNRYDGVLPDMNHGNITSRKQEEVVKTLPEAIQNQPQQAKQEAKHRRAYTAGSGDKKPYGDLGSLWSQINYHHEGHFQKDCPKLKTTKANRGNHSGNNRAPAREAIPTKALYGPVPRPGDSRSVCQEDGRVIPDVHLITGNWG
ncbi:hypothetical protein Tco_1554182 [Tanacetum coccineum]